MISKKKIKIKIKIEPKLSVASGSKLEIFQIYVRSFSYYIINRCEEIFRWNFERSKDWKLLDFRWFYF